MEEKDLLVRDLYAKYAPKEFSEDKIKYVNDNYENTQDFVKDFYAKYAPDKYSDEVISYIDKNYLSSKKKDVSGQDSVEPAKQPTTPSNESSETTEPTQQVSEPSNEVPAFSAEDARRKEMESQIDENLKGFDSKLFGDLIERYGNESTIEEAEAAKKDLVEPKKYLDSEINKLNIAQEELYKTVAEISKSGEITPEIAEDIKQADSIIKKKADDLAEKVGVFKAEYQYLSNQELVAKAKQGNFFGGSWNSILEGIGTDASGKTSYAIDLLASLAPDELIAGRELTDEERESRIEGLKQDLLPYVRKGAKELVGDGSTTDEYLQKQQEGFFGGAWHGLVKSAPAMASPYMTGIFFQTSDAIEQELEGAENMSSGDKLLIKAPLGLASAALERVGIKNLAQNKAISKIILKKAIDKTPKKASAKMFKDILNNEINGSVDSYLRLGLNGFLAEAETGGLQAATEIGYKNLYESITDKEVFDAPTEAGEILSDVIYSAGQEGVGGFIMSQPFAIKKSIDNKNLGKIINDPQFELVEQISSNQKVRDFVIGEIRNRQNAGLLTKQEAEEQIDGLMTAATTISKMDDDLSTENKRKAFDLVLEKDGLEQELEGMKAKDQVLVKSKIERANNRLEEINNELEQISQTKTETDGIQDEQAELQEVGQEETKEEVTPTNTKPLSPKKMVGQLTKNLEGKGGRKKISTPMGDVGFNYNVNGVEVTLSDDLDFGEINDEQVQADVSINSIAVTDESVRGSGAASKELDRIIKLADDNGMSLSLMVDPDGASIGVENKGNLSREQLKEWYKRKGFEFEEFSSYGYRKPKTEQLSKERKTSQDQSGAETNQGQQANVSPAPVAEQGATDQIESLRRNEQKELLEAIPEAENAITDGKVDRSKIESEEGKAKFDEIYDKYDKLISPLLESENTTASKDNDFFIAEKGELRGDFKDVKNVLTGKIKAKDFFSYYRKRFLSAKKFLPKNVFGMKEKKEATIARELNIIEQFSADFRKAVKSFKGTEQEKQSIINNFDEFIRGNKDAELPENLKAIGVEMRAQIDRLSNNLINEGLIAEHQVDKVSSNLGQYITRSYKVFDRENWKDEVQAEVKQKAINFFKKELREYAEDYVAENGGNVDEVLEVAVSQKMNDLLNREGASNFVGTSKLGKKDLSVMKERKDIPFEIRALMGEYTDPIQNYARTVQKMAALVANARFLKSVKQSGMNEFLFERGDLSRPKEFNTEIAAEGSDIMNPLNGLLTTKEIANEFSDMDESLGDLVQKYMMLVSTVKWAKTIGSIATHAKNIFGNLGFMAVNGHYDITEMAGSYRTIRNDIGKLSNKELRDKMNNYIQLGIVKQSAGVGEIRDMFKDANFDDTLAERLSNRKLNKLETLRRNLLRGKRFAEDMYQGEDDFFKIVAYENEASRYSKAMFGKNKSELNEAERAELNEKIVEIVKNTYPTYDRVPELIQMVRRFPIVGNFVSFQAEAWRTMFNTIQLAREEIGSDNKEVKKIGAKRLAGAIIYESAKDAMISMFGYSAGVGLSGLYGAAFDSEEEDEKDKDIRRFVAPWSKKSDLLILEADNGVVEYIDYSSSDPHGGLRQVINAFATEEDVSSATLSAMFQVVEPFLGEEIATEAILNLRSNQNSYGNQIWNPEAPRDEKIKDIMAYMYKTLELGSVKTLRRIYESDDKNQEFIASFLGLRTYEVDISKQFGFIARDYSDRLKDARKMYNRAFYNPESTDEEVANAYELSNQSVKDIYESMAKDYNSAVRLGAKASDLQEKMSDGGISKYRIKEIRAGKIQDLKKKGKSSFSFDNF